MFNEDRCGKDINELQTVADISTLDWRTINKSDKTKCIFVKSIMIELLYQVHNVVTKI